MAKEVGSKTVNVTMSWGSMDFGHELIQLLRYVDVITESVDENRKSKAAELWVHAYGTLLSNDDFLNTHVNLNILWSPKLMQQFVDKEGRSIPTYYKCHECIPSS